MFFPHPGESDAGDSRKECPSPWCDRNLLARCQRKWFNAVMSDHIYKKIELVGSSPNGIEDAINNAITRAGKTIRNMKWVEVAEVRGHLEDNKIADWQVTVKVGFTLDN
jgi:flavin-binding protein dodecin